jgi:endonuclease III
MVSRNFRFLIDQKRLGEVVKVVYEAMLAKEGIFSLDHKTFLPQWNLPKELEFDPQKDETVDPLTAANYLWTCAFFERLSQSRVIMRNSKKVWDSQDRWIFYPKKVVEKDMLKVDEVLSSGFQFGLKGKNEESPAMRFWYNSSKLVSEYDGDPRQIVQGNSVDEARRRLMEFKGIGSGIANLYIIYLLDRKIAFPENPEDILFKVDVHKGRIPLNTNSILPENGEVHRENISRALEQAYLLACVNQGIDPSLTDASLWIIGSELCARQDYHSCSNCPLVDKYCVSNVAEDQRTGRFVVYDKSGKRIETRKNIGQGTLEFDC